MGNIREGGANSFAWNNGKSILETVSIYNEKKNVLGIGVFFDSYLNFTVRVYIRVLVKDLDICKKYEKPTNISLCLIWSKK